MMCVWLLWRISVSTTKAICMAEIEEAPSNLEILQSRLSTAVPPYGGHESEAKELKC